MNERGEHDNMRKRERGGGGRQEDKELKIKRNLAHCLKLNTTQRHT